MNKNNEIILNIMYTGTYLGGDNIGHEAINLFKDDNGKSYIYVLPYGTMNQKHNDKIKTILLIRRHSSKIFEILAKAEGLEQIARVETTHNKEEQKLLQKQSEYIKKNNVTYDGVPVNDIFADNDVGEGIQSVFITFSAKKVTKAAQPIYITVDSDEKTRDKTYYKTMTGIYKFTSQHPKMYISQSDNPKAYNKLEKIINNDKYWGETTRKLAYYHKPRGSELASHNIIDIIKKGHDELCYSNLLQHFFKENRKVFRKFAKKVLGVANFNEDFTVLREWKNIDILIGDAKNKNVIVIENKIKSGINGADEQHNIGSNLVQSQLKKYYDCVEKEYKNSKRKYFIFAPDYNHINLDNYACGKNYKLIKYSKIFNFFEENKDEFKGVAYFREFLYALQKQAKLVDNSNEEDMLKRFTAKIEFRKNKR